MFISLLGIEKAKTDNFWIYFNLHVQLYLSRMYLGYLSILEWQVKVEPFVLAGFMQCYIYQHVLCYYSDSAMFLRTFIYLIITLSVAMLLNFALVVLLKTLFQKQMSMSWRLRPFTKWCIGGTCQVGESFSQLWFPYPPADIDRRESERESICQGVNRNILCTFYHSFIEYLLTYPWRGQNRLCCCPLL